MIQKVFASKTAGAGQFRVRRRFEKEQFSTGNDMDGGCRAAANDTPEDGKTQPGDGAPRGRDARPSGAGPALRRRALIFRGS